MFILFLSSLFLFFFLILGTSFSSKFVPIVNPTLLSYTIMFISILFPLQYLYFP